MNDWDSDSDKKTSLLKIPCARSIDIEFKEIRCSVPGKNEQKQLVKGISGYFKSGELTAIMGPSGAGKTTLLNILTGFKTAEGTISSTGFRNSKIGTKQYSKHSCYILQDNCLDPLFTTEEAMIIAANLKLGSNISQESKEELVYQILEGLQLLACRSTRCGMLSGGQQKRLSVALELIGNPSVMFLDEPTTGLDSSSSHQVIRMLKALADQGRNIVCTIHQPSASLFEVFDFVYVMAEGKSIYQGYSRNVVSYLASFGLNCPQYHNPADYLMEVANGDYGNFTDTLQVIGRNDKWRKDSKSFDSNRCIIEYNDSESENTSFIQDSPSESLRLWILMKRSFSRMLRDWTISSLKIFLHFVVGIFLGLTYLNVGNDGSKMITNLGFLMVTIVYLCYTSLMPAVLKFPLEINMLKREQYNNWYRLRTYYIACLFIDIPMQISFVLSYVCGSYLLSAQPLDWIRLLKTILVLFFLCMVASSMGIFFGTVVNPVNGTFFGAITLALMLVVAGFLILFTHMSSTMYLLTYISYISYAMEALAQSIYGYERTIQCPETSDFCIYDTPADLLKDVGMDKPTYWKDIGFLFCNFVVMRVLAFCTLKNTLSKI